MAVTKSELLKQTGNFTWFYGADWFIETPIGNFLWRDPEYYGANTITPFKGNYSDACKHLKVSHGRDKGERSIKDFVGEHFELVT